MLWIVVTQVRISSSQSLVLKMIEHPPHGNPFARITRRTIKTADKTNGTNTKIFMVRKAGHYKVGMATKRLRDVWDL